MRTLPRLQSRLLSCAVRWILAMTSTWRQLCKPALCVAILCLAPRAPAQFQRGQLRLEVRDAGGSGIAAHGKLLSTGNGYERNFQLPADGHLLLQDLPFGLYQLRVTAEGFATWSDAVEIRSEIPVKLGITLGVAPLTTKVQVSDSLTLVDPTRTGTIYTAGQQTVHEQLNAQHGRKLGGVVEITTDKAVPAGWHGDLDAVGGSFGMVSGSVGFGYARDNNRF